MEPLIPGAIPAGATFEITDKGIPVGVQTFERQEPRSAPKTIGAYTSQQGAYTGAADRSRAREGNFSVVDMPVLAMLGADGRLFLLGSEVKLDGAPRAMNPRAIMGRMLDRMDPKERAILEAASKVISTVPPYEAT